MSRILLLFFISFIGMETIIAQGPPPWAHAHGYRAKTRYVYFPDHNVYYDLQARNYIYLSGRNWEIRANLPTTLFHLNLGRSAQVELDFAGDRPYRYNADHLVRYKKPKKIKHRSIEIINIEDEHHEHGHGHGRGHGRGHH
ncbi:hypothetical protein [Flavobacterium sp.]|uniref:hypothetical protein n=1 Tax=Flavobacterium sp. TaxID=239 RepID=UPI003D0EB82B